MTNATLPAPAEFTSEQIAADPILHFFHYSHLFPVLQPVSARFCALAAFIVAELPRNAERSVALRKLLEAKDAAVRANLPGTTKPIDRMERGEPTPGEPVTKGPDRSEDPLPFS